MNHIDRPLVTLERIQKAARIGRPGGVERLAKFVCATSTDPWSVFEACQQQRVMALAQPRCVDRRAK